MTMLCLLDTNVLQVSRILTFNTGDFSRYPGVTAINPSSVSPAQ
jgi:hypothetical protein